MICGRRPFPGPSFEDYREQHLHAVPDSIQGVPPGMAAALEQCMDKSPGARPSSASLRSRLDRLAQKGESGRLASLAEADRAAVREQAEASRLASERATVTNVRNNLFASARTSFDRIAGELFGAVQAAAPTARAVGNRGGTRILSMGAATLSITGAERTQENPWQWEAPSMEVIAHASIEVAIPTDRYDYEGRSHSLWFCDAGEEGVFGWWETAFMVSPMLPRRFRKNPAALDPGVESAKALWTGIAEYQVAWPFMPVVPYDAEEFIERWGEWFAAAAQGRLSMPTAMPERNVSGSWRR